MRDRFTRGIASRSRAFVIFSTLALASNSAFCAASSTPSRPPELVEAPIREVDYPEDGVQVGTGWNSLTDYKSQGQCIDFQEKSDDSQDKTLELKNTIDSSSLMTDLKVSASFQVKAILGKASAKAEFARHVQITDDNANFSAYAAVLNGARYWVSPHRD
jgi:hypothetical protein